MIDIPAANATEIYLRSRVRLCLRCGESMTRHSLAEIAPGGFVGSVCDDGRSATSKDPYDPSPTRSTDVAFDPTYPADFRRPMMAKSVDEKRAAFHDSIRQAADRMPELHDRLRRLGMLLAGPAVNADSAGTKMPREPDGLFSEIDSMGRGLNEQIDAMLTELNRIEARL